MFWRRCGGVGRALGLGATHKLLWKKAGFSRSLVTCNRLSLRSLRHSEEKSRMQSTLWEEVQEKTRTSAAAGTLHSISTDYLFLPESVDENSNELQFLVRLVKSLASKPPRQPTSPGSDSSNGKPVDPFENPETTDLFVRLVPPSHALLLNKFNVVDYHLLIVTRHFESQSDHLTIPDLEAASLVINDLNGLIFYNCGTASGSSQPHKHMQFLPLPLLPEKPNPRCPVEKWILSDDPKHITRKDNLLFTLNGFRFHHVCSRFDRPITAKELYTKYQSHLKHLDLLDQGKSYNTIITNRWLMTVARQSEKFWESGEEGKGVSIGINSVAFLGTMLVKNEQELEVVKRIGAMKILEQVAVQKNEV